jgi:hypothetical protein
MNTDEYELFLTECDETQQRISALCNPAWSWDHLPCVAVPFKTRKIGNEAWNQMVGRGLYTRVRLLVEMFYLSFEAGDYGKREFKSTLNPLDLEMLSMVEIVFGGKSHRLFQLDGSSVVLNSFLF